MNNLIDNKELEMLWKEAWYEMPLFAWQGRRMTKNMNHDSNCLGGHLNSSALQYEATQAFKSNGV
jgi:hypothetical protein